MSIILSTHGISRATSHTASCSAPPVISHTECIFSHGIADTGAQALKYTQYTQQGAINGKYTSAKCRNPYYTIEVPVCIFDYPDATRHFWRVNFWKTSLGQHNEMKKLGETIEQRRALYADLQTPVNYILYGVSRGASAIINYVGTITNNNTNNSIKHVKTNCADISALVLESPFDCVQSVATACVNRAHLSKVPHMSSLLHNITSIVFRLYRKDGISPLLSAGTIPIDMPILIICSKKDTLVPWESSYEVYNILRKTGHQNAHILIVDAGKHAHLFSQAYHEVVHAFYKCYALPHDMHAAACGEKLFNTCQPTITNHD